MGRTETATKSKKDFLVGDVDHDDDRPDEKNEIEWKPDERLESLVIYFEDRLLSASQWEKLLGIGFDVFASADSLGHLAGDKEVARQHLEKVSEEKRSKPNEPKPKSGGWMPSSVRPFDYIASQVRQPQRRPRFELLIPICSHPYRKRKRFVLRTRGLRVQQEF